MPKRSPTTHDRRSTKQKPRCAKRRPQSSSLQSRVASWFEVIRTFKPGKPVAIAWHSDCLTTYGRPFTRKLIPSALRWKAGARYGRNRNNPSRHLVLTKGLRIGKKRRVP